VPWLTALWRRLRTSVETKVATPEEAQLFHLIEFVASRFGTPLLQVASIDDLDDRLDELAGSPEAFLATALLAQHTSVFQDLESVTAARFAESVSATLGDAQGRIVSESQQVLDAWFSAQRQASALLANEEITDLDRIFDFSLASPEVPAELARVVFHGLRGGFCSLAIASVAATDATIEPWLARALTERLVTSAKEHLRLLASIPGVTVDEAIVPRDRRFDIEALSERHKRARATADRSYDRARARLGL
jgi:hypothetical protein